MGGELSLLMACRDETKEFAQVLDTCLGYIPLAQGGLTAAPGTKYVASVKNSANATHVVRFEFSTEQAYMIEFGDLYCRFYKDHARIENPPGTPVEVVTPYTAAQVGALQFTQSADGVTWTERANPKNANLKSIGWSGTQFVAVGSSDGVDAYIVTSPNGITWTESANPKNVALRDVAWSGTQFVAVGASDGGDAYITN